MDPPRKPPNKGSNMVRGKRLPFWFRQSDHHPRVESRPGEIKDGVAKIIADLRQLRSPSPGERELSRFSSRPSTPGVTPHPPSHGPVYSYPPPPPPRPHPCTPVPAVSQQLGYPHFAPPYPPPHAPVPVVSQQPEYLHPVPIQPTLNQPTQLPYQRTTQDIRFQPPPAICLPPPPQSDSSQRPQGEYYVAIQFVD